MLATGGTLRVVMRLVLDRGTKNVTALCWLATPEGVAEGYRNFGYEAPVTIVIAGSDERLNDLRNIVGYIFPGPDDARA
jgi:uracil phosphoribosyltransferase